jgi:hypothetical protein
MVVRNEFRKEIEVIQNGIEYDPDSSPKVWEHYSRYYSAKHWYFFENFDFNNFKKVRNKGVTRLISKIKFHSPNFETFLLGGDTDFNFKKDSETRANNYKKFKEILKQGNANSEEFAKLKLCNRHHHTLVNFSLMARTGGMNSTKGITKYDRFDLFISKLDSFYLETDTSIISRKNGEYLANFLDTFEDIYEYFKVFYFIDDKKFVDRIIEEGKQPITNAEDVIRYMNLALAYWHKKEEYFNKYSIE